MPFVKKSKRIVGFFGVPLGFQAGCSRYDAVWFL